jgi:N-acetyl-anhydromuramyl-L-alanine amidase AmpD
MALLGESFNDYVKKQINIRQDKLSLQNKDDDTLKYITSKTSFLRLTSGIDVSKDVAQSLGVTNLNGSLLAKQYVLFSSQFDNKFTSGLGYSSDGFGSNFDVSYGFNSDPNYGLVPPPGLISATVNTLNRGTIREATINLVCHNVYQFKIINALFLKLKYSLLLEWGHTLYFNNNTTSTLSTPINLDLSEAFLNGVSSDEILDQIENKRKESCGNYDAFFGVVKNFNWDLQENGSYNITVIAISQGSLIDSLKVNSNVTPNINIGGNEPQYQKSTLHKILGEITKKIATGPGGESGAYKGYLHGYKGADGEIALNTINIAGFTGLDYGYKHPNDVDAVTGANNILTHNEGTAITFPSLQLDGSAGSTAIPVTQYYIKLGALLRIVESFVLYYDTSKKNKDGYPPIFYIDHDFDANECLTFPRHISTDPLTCLLPPDYTNAAQLNKTVYSTYNSTITTYVYTTDGTTVTRISSNVTSNPNLLNDPNPSIPEDRQSAETVIGTKDGFGNPLTEVKVNFDSLQDAVVKIQQYASSLTNQNITITTQTITKNTEYAVNNESQAGNLAYVEKGFRTSNKFIGKTMHIYVNVNKIIEVLDRNIDDDGNISVYTFLTSLLSDLKYALGSVNKFDINYDSSNNRFYIIDSAVLPFKYEKNTGVARFNVNLLKTSKNGGGSFVTNFGLKSEVFSKVANAIALGAQGNGNTMISNSTPLSNFNTGLTDRSMRNKQNPNLLNAKEDEGFDQFEAAYIAYEDYKRKVASSSPEPGESLTADDIATYRSYLVDLFNYDLGTYANNGNTPGTGFIPLNLQLTMDGLSGIKQYQVFAIDETLLPNEYQNRLSFITTTISHKISINGWETTLNSLSIPKKSKKEKTVVEKAPPPPKKQNKPQTVDVSSMGVGRISERKGRKNEVNPSAKKGKGIKRTPRSITLHYTDYPNSPEGVINGVGSKYGGRGGIHYAIDVDGRYVAGVPEDIECIHGDNWNTFGIGIEIITEGAVKPVSKQPSNYGGPKPPPDAAYYENVYSSTYRNERYFRADQVVDLGFKYGGGSESSGGSQYFVDYTDAQINGLENLIRGILQRWPGINNNIQGNNLYEWVFGFHRSKLNSEGRPFKDGRKYVSLTAGVSTAKDTEAAYTLKTLGGPGGYLGPNGYKKGGYNVQGGIYSHATGGGDHTDIFPSPKIVAMLVRLGFKDGK